MRQIKHSRTNGLAVALPFLLPSLIGFLVFSILPIIATLFISLTSWDGLSRLTLVSNFKGFMGTYFVGFGNYQTLFANGEIAKVLLNTTKFVVLYIPLMIVVSLAVAGILNSKLPGIGFFRVVYYIPVITSWVAGSLIWRWVFNPQYGIFNSMLALIGIEGPKWLQSPEWAMPAIVIASVWKDMGYFGLMLLAGLQGINREYYEAASIDGAGRVKKFFKITLPLLSPTLFFVLIISMINSFQIFPQVVIMTPDGGPGGSTMVMVERIYKYGFKYYQMGMASSISWILFIIIMVLTFIQLKLQNKWVNYDD